MNLFKKNYFVIVSAILLSCTQQQLSVKSCVQIQRELNSALDIWIIEQGSENIAELTVEDLFTYIKGDVSCPSGGTFIIIPDEKRVVCSIHENNPEN